MYASRDIGEEDEGDDDEEDDDMCLGEDGDKLRDRVVGHYAGEQFCLVDPAPVAFVGGELHPYGVDAVLWDDAYVANYDMVVLHDREGVGRHEAHLLFGLLYEEEDGVGVYLEVIAFGEVVGGVERYGVELLLGICCGAQCVVKAVIVCCGAVTVAGADDYAGEEEGEEAG